MKKAFTLSEILLSLVIMGLIAGTIGSQYRERVFDTEKTQMTFSAYNTTKQVIRELLTENASLPATGAAFCTQFADYYNPIIVNCSTTATTTNDSSNFATAVPNFSASNGLKFFNLQSNPVSDTYTFYIDINGNKNPNKYNVDVLKFTTTLKGAFMPVANSLAANETKYLSAGYYAIVPVSATYPDGKMWIVTTNLTFREAMCRSGKISGTYCNTTSNPNYPSYSKNTNCNTYPCDVQVRNVSYLFRR